MKMRFGQRGGGRGILNPREGSGLAPSKSFCDMLLHVER